MKKLLLLILCVLLIALLHPYYYKEKHEILKEDTFRSYYDGRLGSAGNMEGRALIISIFADDENTTWKNSKDGDKEVLERLEIACDYLQNEVSKYNRNIEFIYDYTENQDIRYDVIFDESLVSNKTDIYNIEKEWIEKNIDTKELQKKYEVDHLVFIVFMNTERSNEVNPWIMPYSRHNDNYIEIINMYMKFDGFDTPASTFAHEIMHAFGAHYLYYSNEYIRTEYVNYLIKTKSNDIMFTVTSKKEITNEFTPLDAYYVGIAPKVDEIDKYSLAESEHVQDDKEC